MHTDRVNHEALHMQRVILTLLVLFFPSLSMAINTGGDFNNRSNFRPANPETKIITRIGHDYSPSLMRDVDGLYKMWWCGAIDQNQGDNILYSQATSLAGPWSTPISVFKGTAYTGGSTTGWDANQTCDPSVIRVNGTYYMYYGGINNSVSGITRTGVASSPNGTTWTRLNGGNWIVGPFDPSATVGISTPNDTSDDYYGAGQPSVLYIDGWFYMFYSDDTGSTPAQPWGYLLRSTDPTFPNSSATQELLEVSGQVGFHPLSASRYQIVRASNADVIYLPGAQRFVVAIAAFFDQVTGYFFNKNFLPASPPGPVDPFNAFGYTDIPGTWTEGYALLRTPWGHGAFNSANLYSSQCVVPLDAIRSIGPLGPLNSPLWDLAWTGMDVTFNTRCGDVVADNRFDFDGDRVADRIVYRSTNGTFYKYRSADGFQTATFGTNDFIPIHGDFDGDGKDDHGGLDPNGGFLNWQILQSSNGSFRTESPWGLVNDQTAVADYNADGKDDVAVWRPSNGTWYVKYQSGAIFAQAWGASGDIAVPADYNGDGFADLAIYRPNSTGNPALSEWWVWHYAAVPQTFAVVQWGFPGDIPVPGDWFADGKVDYGVFRPSNGTWYLKNSVTGATETVQFGLPGDVPVVADYNGDGKLDLTVWRPSNGNWYTNFRIGTPYIVQQFGLNGDKVPEK